jgi:hypothetical protein
MYYNNRTGCICVKNQHSGSIPHHKPGFSDLNHIQQNLWPYPNNITQGDNIFRFNKMNSNNNVWTQYNSEIDISYNNPLKDFALYIKQFNKDPSLTPSGVLNFNKITINNPTYLLKNLTSSSHKNDESYTLTVSETGSVEINAETFIGIGFALATLQQLIELDETTHSGCSIKNLPITITDGPNTYYRNVLLDTARTFFSTESICDLLRNMGHHKMNYLDWHINDNQSFPINVGPITNIFSSKLSSDSTFKEMTGGFDVNKVYQPTDVQKIIKTARNYGITVVPGIDSPGHCSALMYGSVEATKNIFGTGFQIVNNYQLSQQGWKNAPEPIVGYLNIGDPTMTKTHHDENIKKIAGVIQVIFDEIIQAFGMSVGKYGDRLNLNIDEVAIAKGYFHKVYEQETFKDYLNRLLDIFDPAATGNAQITNYINNTYSSKIKTPATTWKNLKLSFWIDPVVSLNNSGTDDAPVYYDKFSLIRFSANKRLTFGLWNVAPPSIKTVNLITNKLNAELVNYDANMYYMDAGYPGNMHTGISIQYKDNTLTTALNRYWISTERASPLIAGTPGYVIGFGKIYTHNFNYSYVVDATGKVTGISKIDNVIGLGLAVWSETITEGTLNSKLLTNLLAASEVLWKYNEEYGSDNVYHATYRSQYQMLKLQLQPYNIINETPVYSGSNIIRSFPQGNRMDKNIPTGGNGNITQQYLDTNYKAWDIKIRPSFVGMLNNNLMYNINPTGENGAKAIAQYPLSSKFMYGFTPQVNGSGSEIYTRVNPWLAEDINTLYPPIDSNKYTVQKGDWCSKIAETVCGKGSNYKGVLCGSSESFCKGLQPGQTIYYNCKGCTSSITGNIGRSNFSSKSVYYKDSPFYTDQQDAPIVLTDIIYYKETKG